MSHDPNHPRCPTTGKLRYTTMGSAEHALAQAILSKRNYRRHEERAYRCEHCDGWHLTSQTRRRKY